MKNKIFNQLGLKVISLIIAVAIWIVVANVDDYKTTKKITGIEIEFVNGNAITEKNKVYEVPEGTTIDVVVKGRRSVVEELTSEDFKAVADLSKMSVTNAVMVQVSAISSYIGRDLTISYTGDNAIVIAVENKVEKQLPITVRTTSDVAEGYAIRTKTATPNLITVKGAESVVNTIKEVVVDVDVQGSNHNLTAEAEPVFIDNSDKVIDSTKFEYDVKKVEAFVEILKTKELAVKIKTTGDVKDGYAIASIDYQPTSIVVVGESEDLAKVDELLIDNVDISGCDSDLETAINIADYLPSGIALADVNQEIMIKVDIEPVEEKELQIETDDINIVGKQNGYRYTLKGSGTYVVKVRGLKEDLEKLKVNNFIPSIDVSGVGPGTYTVNVNLREIKGIELLDALTVELEVESIE